MNSDCEFNILIKGKRAGSDKKLYKNLEEQYQVQLSKSPEAFEGVAVSPFGPLTESSSRKTLINLISILNASFSDYDFSNAKSEQFRKETSPYMVINSINTMLSNVIENFNVDMGPKLWTAIDNEIRLKECDIYTYSPESDADPYAEDDQPPPVWSFHYFCYNKKLKRIIYFTCRAISKIDRYSNDIGNSISYQSDDDDDMWDHNTMEL